MITPPTTPRWEGFNDDHRRCRLRAAPKLIEYVHSGRKTIPTFYSPHNFAWFFVALYVIDRPDPFLLKFATTFDDHKHDGLVETRELIAVFEAERNAYKALRAEAQGHLDEFRICPPTKADLETAITTTWNKYVATTKNSTRESYQAKRDLLKERVEKATRVEISEADKEFLRRRHYMNPFVTEGCLAGYDYQTHETEELLRKIEGIWQERDEACAAFEVRWDRLKYTLENRCTVPGDRIFHLWRRVNGGYVAKETERDHRETESPLRNAKEEPPPEPYRWLDLAAEMWRLYGVKRRLQELEAVEGDPEEIAQCQTYEEFVMGPAEAITADQELLARASTLQDDMISLHGEFITLYTSMENTNSDTYGTTDEGVLDTIKTKTIPGYLASYNACHEKTRTMTRTFNQIRDELQACTRGYTSPATQLGASLEALGFITDKEFQKEHAAMATLHNMANDWIVSLNRENMSLEETKHQVRIWYDWLYATADNDFSTPSIPLFFAKRIILGVTYIGRENPIQSDDKLPEIVVTEEGEVVIKESE